MRRGFTPKDSPFTPADGDLDDERSGGFEQLSDAADRLNRGGATNSDPIGRRTGGKKQEIEFGRRQSAQEARELLPENALTEKYDGRHKTVEVQTDKVPEAKLNRVSGLAADSKDHRENKAGQVPLTDAERADIDFTETTVPEARSAKGILMNEGVDDFTSYFDETLTVDEHREIAKKAARDSKGKRMDNQATSVEREANAFRRSQEELKDHAIKGARMGEEEAVRTLIDEIGMSPQRARSFAQQADSPEERAQLVKTEIGRAKANGRFLSMRPDPAPESPGMRAQSTGRYIGDEVVRADPGARIKRDPETGEFRVETE